MTTPIHSLHSGGNGRPDTRLVFFDVTGRRDLAQRAAAAAPGVRFKGRGSWVRDPGEPRRPLLGGGEPRAGLWLWRGTEQQLAEQATAVLLQFIHPLVSRHIPYCLGFPFGAEVFTPRRLGLGDAAALDLEDIGRLLGIDRPAYIVAILAPIVRATSGDALPAGPSMAPSVMPSVMPGRATTLSPASRPRATANHSDAGQPPLDAAQRAAVEHAIGPARVLAPAGAGKTKTLVARVVQLIDRGVDPSGILMLAFNRKAAEQLEERLATHGIETTRRIGSPDGAGSRSARQRPHGVHCATFNAFGYRYQREVLGARISLDQSGAELRALMRRAIEASGVALDELRPTRGSDPVGAFMAALTRVHAALEPPEEIEIGLQSTGEQPVVTLPFAPAHEHFTRAQMVTGHQSFDDQIYFAVADMLADPDHRCFIQSRFDHVLVDEFQDLNGAQLTLVDLLSRPSRDLYVVGDDDQLIYGWRQADPRGILEFHERMPPPPWSATYTLGTNYRCSRAVVESSARLVANNSVREAKDIRPRAGADEGALRFAGAPSWPERAEAICDFVRAEKSRLACDWRDLAVLCRYRSQQFAVALALDGAGIPRSPTLGCRLFTHPAARLLRTYVDLVLTPDAVAGDDLAFLLNRPNRFLTRAVVEAVGAASRPWARVRSGAAAEPAAHEPSAGPRPLSTLVEQIQALRAASFATAAELVQAIIDDFELVEHFRLELESRRERGGEPDGGGPLQVLDALYLLAEMHPDLAACLAAWDRLRADEVDHTETGDDSLEREQAEDRVVIGTIHAAKGREYDAVVIPEYACDVSRWEPPEVEEERRVVYVGVTRARDSVLFTVDTTMMYVQPFLRELVETPDPDEYHSMTAWLDEEDDVGLQRRLRQRLNEIEVLFPELVEPAAESMVPAGASRLVSGEEATT